MGGQNHQPTNRIMTAASAWLSQRVGEGFLEVLKANNHLEDAIMLGMDKVHIEDFASSLGGSMSEHIEATIHALRRSKVSLDAIPTGYKRLIDIAAKIGYKGNPHVSQLNALDLYTRFEGALIRPAINENAWRELHEMIRTRNILDTLAWEAEQFSSLGSDTDALIATIEQCREINATSGGNEFVNAIENNEIPLRQHYARVFSRWNHLHAMFLYSALIMTELFYKLNNYPSLTVKGSESVRPEKVA